MTAATSSASASAAAAAAALSNAVKACGCLVKVEPEEFLRVLARVEEPLVVYATGGLFSTHHKYLTSYKGLVFHCKHPQPLRMPPDAEVIRARRLSIPDV